jgi:hypothetical protein
MSILINVKVLIATLQKVFSWSRLNFHPERFFRLQILTCNQGTGEKPNLEGIRNFFSAGFVVTCLKEGDESSPKLLDHVLYLENKQKIIFKDDQIIFPEFELKGKMCPLSDHHPRVVTLEI